MITICRIPIMQSADWSGNQHLVNRRKIKHKEATKGQLPDFLDNPF